MYLSVPLNRRGAIDQKGRDLSRGQSLTELAETINQPLVERPPYRWWVLANVVLVYVLIPGIAWNYIIMVVPNLLGDLGLEIGQWGILWAGISLGVLISSVPAGARSSGQRVA